MSTRWYPLYQKGNPQLRVFLPNFWMKLVKNQHEQPSNVVQFHCSMEMTRYDVQNYLEKIYKIKVMDVRTRIKLGQFKRALNGEYIIKEDDIKVAYAILPKDQSFVFPDLFPASQGQETESEERKSVDEMKIGFQKFLKMNNKPGIPGWFGI